MPSMQDRVLAELLADVDAVFLPVRNWTTNESANRYLFQQEYANRGTRWQSRSGLETERKQLDRALGELEAAGVVKLDRPRGSRFPYARIVSDDAEFRMRSLCRGVYAAATWTTMLELASTAADIRCELVSDWRLATAGCPAEKVGAQVEDMLLAALVRGWVQSGTDVHGRVYYRLTETGKERLAGEAPPIPENLIDVDPELGAIYAERILDGIRRMREASPIDPREIGFMPLPVSGPHAEAAHRSGKGRQARRARR